MYLYDGRPEYQLTYEIPASSVSVREAETGDATPRLSFIGLSAQGVGEPDIGFLNLDLREPGGGTLAFGEARLTCGTAPALVSRFSSPKPPPPGPINFLEPFYDHKSEMPACLDAVRKSGTLTLAFAREPGGPEVMTIRVKLRLASEIDAAKRIWMRETARAARGTCRMPPGPPPPF